MGCINRSDPPKTDGTCTHINSLSSRLFRLRGVQSCLLIMVLNHEALVLGLSFTIDPKLSLIALCVALLQRLIQSINPPLPFNFNLYFPIKNLNHKDSQTVTPWRRHWRILSFSNYDQQKTHRVKTLFKLGGWFTHIHTLNLILLLFFELYSYLYLFLKTTIFISAISGIVRNTLISTNPKKSIIINVLITSLHILLKYAIYILKSIEYLSGRTCK